MGPFAFELDALDFHVVRLILLEPGLCTCVKLESPGNWVCANLTDLKLKGMAGQ